MTRTPEALTQLITTLDVRNNPTFLPGKLLVPAELVGPNSTLALYNGQKYGVIPYTRCSGFAGAVFAGMGVPFPAGKTANEQLAWLAGDEGRAAVWAETKVLGEAITAANAGLAVAIVAHEDPHGHIGAGVPNPADLQNLYCAAAGSFNTPRQLYSVQFDHLAHLARFFIHP
jgi:hypothetical protein